jgi:ribosomal protein S18 acetylase RimI-like enzyme
MSAIRRLTLDDVALFVEIRRLSLQTDPDSFSARLETDAGSKLETARERFAAATPANGPFVLGAIDAKVLGIVGVIRSSPTSSEIWGFYVRPECRGGGLGRALLLRAIEVTRQMPGVTRIELGVSQASTAARHLYVAAGFRDVRFDAGTRTQYMKLDLDAG